MELTLRRTLNAALVCLTVSASHLLVLAQLGLHWYRDHVVVQLGAVQQLFQEATLRLLSLHEHRRHEWWVRDARLQTNQATFR